MNEKLIRNLELLGIVSLLSYTAAVVFSPLMGPGYNWKAQAVSDLSAESAPSRTLWTQLSAGYMPCGIVCVTVCCVAVKGRYNRIVRVGVYLFAAMSWVSTVGYTMFPLTAAGLSGQFQDVMHLVVTAAVVLLSLSSLAMIAFGGLAQKGFPSLGWWALAALTLMMTGAVGTAMVPPAFFGIPERFSVFAAAGFTAALGVCPPESSKFQSRRQKFSPAETRIVSAGENFMD